MKVFASWSGGKDCMLALYRQQISNNNEVLALVNMCDSGGEYSRSHGIKSDFIKKQAEAMGISIIQKMTDREGYEANFKSVIEELKKDGIEGGIFGDIYLMEHRTWIERVCSEMEIRALFPLWENNTALLLKEFIDAGFKALTVAVNNNKLENSWLGRELNNSFYNDIAKLEGIDPCAENGEYHSFVYDGPLFNKAVQFQTSEIYKKDNHSFLKLA